MRNAECGVDTEQQNALPAGQLLLAQCRNSHQQHNCQHHRNLINQRQVQAGIQQRILAGNVKGSQRDSHTGDKNQIEDVGADYVADAQRAAALLQRSDGGDQLGQGSTQCDEQQSNDRFGNTQFQCNDLAMIDQQIEAKARPQVEAAYEKQIRATIDQGSSLFLEDILHFVK